MVVIWYSGRSHDGCNYRSRNCLPVRFTRVQPGFPWGWCCSICFLGSVRRSLNVFFSFWQLYCFSSIYGFGLPHWYPQTSLYICIFLFELHCRLIIKSKINFHIYFSYCVETLKHIFTRCILHHWRWKSCPNHNHMRWCLWHFHVQAYLFPQWSNLSTEISHRRSFESPAVHQMCLVTTYNKFESAVKHHKSRQPNYNKFTNGKWYYLTTEKIISVILNLLKE